MNLSALGISFLCLIASQTSADAALAVYSFTHTGAGTVEDPVAANPNSSDTDVNSVASAFSGAGYSGSNGGISNSTDMAFIRSNSLTTAAATAISGGDYFQFTVTPVTGFVMDLTSITLDFGGSNSGTGSAAFTSSAVLRSSLAGTPYSTDLGAISSDVTAGSSNSQLAARTFDLTGLGFSEVTTPVTFRLYIYASANTVSNQIVRLDNLVLNGTTSAIPEPAGAGLLAFGAASLLVRRKRKGV